MVTPRVGRASMLGVLSAHSSPSTRSQAAKTGDEGGSTIACAAIASVTDRHMEGAAACSPLDLLGRAFGDTLRPSSRPQSRRSVALAAPGRSVLGCFRRPCLRIGGYARVSIRPCSNANAVAAAREVTPILVKMLETCRETVLMLR